MSFEAGRAAVQARLDELETERSLLLDILSSYDALGALSGASASTLTNGADGAPTLARRHKKEAFLCSRCNASFKTKGWRDRHERKHPTPPAEPFRQAHGPLVASA